MNVVLDTSVLSLYGKHHFERLSDRFSNLFASLHYLRLRPLASLRRVESLDGTLTLIYALFGSTATWAIFSSFLFHSFDCLLLTSSSHLTSPLLALQILFNCRIVRDGSHEDNFVIKSAQTTRPRKRDDLSWTNATMHLSLRTHMFSIRLSSQTVVRALDSLTGLCKNAI